MFRFVKLLSALWLLALGGAFAQDLAENTARIHYTRPDGVYDAWKLHVWEDTTETVTWGNGLDVTGEDDYGVYWDVGLTDDAQTLGFIVHKGDEKDPGPDMFLMPGEMGNEVWVMSGDSTIYTQLPDATTAAPKGDLGKAQAHWLSRDTVAWNLGEVPEGAQVTLHYAPDAGLTLGEKRARGRRERGARARRSPQRASTERVSSPRKLPSIPRTRNRRRERHPPGSNRRFL